MITKTSTIAQFRDELRGWVRFRRRMADVPSELPSISALERMAANSVSNLLRNTRIEGATPDIFTWSLFGIVYNSDPVPSLALVAYQKKAPFVLASFLLDIRIEMSDSQKYTYVHDIGEVQIIGSFPTQGGFLTEQSTMEDAICYAAQCTANLTEKEPALRWLLNVPEQARLRHPICPQCGCESVYIGEFTENGRTAKRATCSYCSWTSKHKYAYLSEFVEEESFRKELANVRAESDALKTVERAQEDLDIAIQRLQKICQDKAIMRHASYNFKQMVKKAAEELTKLAAEADSIRPGKKNS